MSNSNQTTPRPYKYVSRIIRAATAGLQKPHKSKRDKIFFLVPKNARLPEVSRFHPIHHVRFIF